ncbi:MAG: hypothetical protein VB078_11930 [Clostridiaceae bacterium]|nr:hypothetical protein [Clostridiaceae bacterium]
MNWKVEAEDKLKGYVPHKLALDNITDELTRLESRYTSIRGATLDGMPKGRGSSAREDAILSNIVHRQELELTFKQAELWVATVDRALDVLEPDERLVLDRFYINPARGNVGVLRDELGLQEDSSVYRRKDKALRRFTLALYGLVES